MKLCGKTEKRKFSRSLFTLSYILISTLVLNSMIVNSNKIISNIKLLPMLTKALGITKTVFFQFFIFLSNGFKNIILIQDFFFYPIILKIYK